MAKKLLNLDTDSGALSFEDGGALPSGTANQTLRHNGTDWVATINSTLTDGNANVEFKMVNGALPDKKYVKYFVSDSVTSLQLASDTVSTNGVKKVSISSTATSAQIYASTANNQFINIYAEDTYQTINMRPNGTQTSQTLTIKTTKNYDANSKVLEFINKFSIYQDGKIVSNYLSGTGSALLEATADGTIQRSATVPTKTKIINRVLSSASSIHSFDNTDLGISGDLTTKIISFELLRKISGNDYFSLGELVQTDKTLTSTAVTFATGEIPSGDTIRLAITYID